MGENCPTFLLIHCFGLAIRVFPQGAMVFKALAILARRWQQSWWSFAGRIPNAPRNIGQVQWLSSHTRRTFSALLAALCPLRALPRLFCNFARGVSSSLLRAAVCIEWL
jgi:hypothetical protein